MNKILLNAENINVSYGNLNVIEELSLTLFKRSFIGLIGPNGAGKTTLMQSLSGQFKPKSGRIVFENNDIYYKNLEYKREISYVHENPFAYPFLKVEEFLHFIAGIRRINKSEINERINSILKSVFLHNERHKTVSALSFGMRKKLAIAAAMIGNPQIIFLDEALNGIDIESVYEIKKMLKNAANAGAVVILSTHVLEVIENICNRYLVLKNGKIIADIDADSFKEKTTGQSGSNLEKHIIKLMNMS